MAAAEVTQRVGDVGPEPRFGSHDMDQREQHLGRRDHGEAIDDPGAAEQLQHNDGTANERKLKGANARHETPSAFFELLAQQRPEPAGQGAERRIGDQRGVALARPAGRHDVDEAAGPCRHHRDAVRQHRRLVQRMRDQHHRCSGFAPEPQQFLAHQQARLLVERAERLVEQNETRPQHERARDADALAHAAGQLRRIGAAETGEAHECKRLVHAAANFRAIGAGPAQAECDIVPHVEPREAGIFLKHNPDLVGDGAGDVTAFHLDGARRRRDEPRDDLEQRALAAARRPDHADELAAAEFEIERPERRHRPLGRAGGIGVRDAAQRQVDLGGRARRARHGCRGLEGQRGVRHQRMSRKSGNRFSDEDMRSANEFRAGGAGLRRAGFGRSACSNRTAP